MGAGAVVARRMIRSTFVMLAAAWLAGCGPLALTPANAATILFLNPSSIRAGFTIEIRATCGDNANPAFVHSAAFGSVTLVPHLGVLAENVTIRSEEHTSELQSHSFISYAV